MQTKTCVLLIALINLLSMAFTAPYAHHMTSAEGKNSERTCQVNVLAIVIENLAKRFSILNFILTTIEECYNIFYQQF